MRASGISGKTKKMNNDSVIKFKAEIIKIQTVTDGGIRLTFDISETDIDIATKLMQVKQAGAILEIVAVPVILDPNVLLLQDVTS